MVQEDFDGLIPLDIVHLEGNILADQLLQPGFDLSDLGFGDVDLVAEAAVDSLGDRVGDFKLPLGEQFFHDAGQQEDQASEVDRITHLVGLRVGFKGVALVDLGVVGNDVLVDAVGQGDVVQFHSLEVLFNGLAAVMLFCCICLHHTSYDCTHFHFYIY